MFVDDSSYVHLTYLVSIVALLIVIVFRSREFTALKILCSLIMLLGAGFFAIGVWWTLMAGHAGSSTFHFFSISLALMYLAIIHVTPRSLAHLLILAPIAYLTHAVQHFVVMIFLWILFYGWLIVVLCYKKVSIPEEIDT